MNETMMFRQELKTFIDLMPERSLYALKPLLSVLAQADEPLIVETDLTNEEKAIIAKGRRRYAECPESFTPLENIK